MGTLSSFLIVAIALTLFASILIRFKLNPLSAFLVTGVIIGPSGLHWIDSIPVIHTISELGVVLLMFSLGLEFSVSKLMKLLESFLRLGIGQVFLTIFVVMALACGWYDFTPSRAFVAGSLMALSSTAVVLRLLQDRRETETPFGRSCISILLFQDIAVLPLMALLPMLALHAGTGGATELSMLKIFLPIGVLLLTFGIGTLVIPTLFRFVSTTQSRELFFFSVASLCLGMAVLMEKSGLSYSVGAFIAGILISESAYASHATSELSLMKDNFLGLFFVSVGMLLDLSFVRQNWVVVMSLLPLAFTVKLVVVTAVIWANGLSWRIALSTGLRLNQIGEFSFILATSALGYGILSSEDYQIFLSLAVLSLPATPFLFFLADRLHLRKNVHDGRIESNVSLGSAEGHVIVVGLGHAGQAVMQSLKDRGIDCIGIELNAKTVTQLQNRGWKAVYGDASRADILHHCEINRASLMVISVTGRTLTSHILTTVHRLRPGMPLLIRTHFVQDLQEIQFKQTDHVIVSEEVSTEKLLDKLTELLESLPPAQIPEAQTV